MSVVIKQVANVSFVEISGRVTIDGGDSRLLASVRRLVAQGRREVVFVLDQVPYMDSAGLTALVTSYRLLQDAGGTLRLLNPSRRVDDVLHLTGIDTLFHGSEPTAQTTH